MKKLIPIPLALLLCGCKIITYTEGPVHFRSYSLGTKTTLANIDKDGQKLKVEGYTVENQEVKGIVDAAVQAAIKGAAKAIVPTP